MKTIITALTDVPEGLRGEYEKKDDVFVLKLDGEPHKHPVFTELASKVDEFRTNNVVLLKEKEARELKLKEFEGFDPKELTRLKEENETLKKGKTKGEGDVDQQIAVAVKKVQDEMRQQLEGEKQERLKAERALKHTEVERKLRAVAGKLKVDERAMPDFLGRAFRVFNDDGVAIDGDKQLYSKKNPMQPLSMDEWGELQLTEAPHLFAASGGGGARPGPGGAGRRTISTDPLEVGRNLEAVAKGEIIVIPGGGSS